MTHCSKCDDCGLITVWFLVTYRDNTNFILRAEPLGELTYESAMAFASQITRQNQSVLSAAMICPHIQDLQTARTDPKKRAGGNR